MPKTCLNPPDLFPSQQYGFSQIVKTSGGTTVYFSGQVGWDEHEALTNGRDLAGQVRRAYENLQTAVQAAGGEMRDVVSLRIYIVNYHRATDAGVIRACQLEFFPPDALPVTTWIGVQALAHPDLLVEVEAVAVIEE